MGEYISKGDFEKAKSNQDDKSILKSCLKRHIKEKVDISTKTENAINYIIDAIEDEFLSDVVSYKEQFLEKAKESVANLFNEQSRLTENMRSLDNETKEKRLVLMQLKDAISKLETRISELCDIENTETDPMLVGAKKAYTWIYMKTYDYDAAKKAFNSYLLGGRPQIGETFTESVFDKDKVLDEIREKTYRRV